MKKISLFIDYPTSTSKTFRGLSFPQVLFDYLSKQANVELVRDTSSIDVLLVINGGSHHHTFFNKVKQKFARYYYYFLHKKIDYQRFLHPNTAYQKRLKQLIKQNPDMKIVHRLDDRHKMLCKLYGFDKTTEWINKRATTTIFQSNYCQSLYARPVSTIFGRESAVSTNNPVLIHNGVDRTVFSEKGETFNLEGKIKIFHVAATGMVRKGLGLVLEIAEILKENTDIQFYLVGRQQEDPIYGNDIQYFSNVHQLPFTSDRYELAKYYRTGDMLLFPSIHDCSPNVVIEAMSCGMPVVAADSGGTPELIIKQDIKGGLLLNPENPIYAVKEVIENLEQFEKNAIDLVKKYHDIEVVGAQYLEVFQEAVRNR